MAYVKANTAPIFGARFQAISPLPNRLNGYYRASFPLPTTGWSAPIGRGLGNPGAFYEGPFPSYKIPEWSQTRATATLGGEWVPPGPPMRSLYSEGAIAYRIDPQSGQYVFGPSGLMPRGLFVQSTFQHPVRPALSSLGVPVKPCGQQLVQINGRQMVMNTTPIQRGPSSQDPMVRLRAAFSGALGNLLGDCKCGGKCGCRGGLGNPGDACTLDSDCSSGESCSVDGACMGSGSTLPTCAWDGNGNLVPGSPLACSPKQPAGPSALQQVNNTLQQVVNGLQPRTNPPTVPIGNWFNGSTVIAGTAVPNPLLAGAIALLGFSIAAGGRRR